MTIVIFFAITFFLFLILAWFLICLVQRNLIDKFTAVNDLPTLGKTRSSSQKLQGTAVVAGASIAGLLAARVCSDHFQWVLVIEPESGLGCGDHKSLEKSSESDGKLRKRARVPQYTAPHAYQVLTFRALKILFPEFEDRLLSWGGRVLPADLRVHISGRPISPPPRLTLSNMTISCQNVRFLNGSVIGVVPRNDSARNRHLDGVIIRTNEINTIQAATLVVDCTGPAQLGLKWLVNAGYSLHPLSTPRVKLPSLKTIYNPKFSGTSCHFRISPDAMRGVPIPHVKDPKNDKRKTGGYDGTGCLYLYIPDPRRDTRNFLIQRVEDDWLQIVCSGYDIMDRPTSIADIKCFISKTTPTIPIPLYIFELLDVLDQASVAKAWHYIRVPPLSFVRYHEAYELPANFVAIGDATCRLNPIHGQGTTMATICAVTLNAALADNANGNREALPPTFSCDFFCKQANRLRETWDANKSDDYGFKTTTPAQGEDLSYGWFRRWYGTHLAEIASKDEVVAATLWQIENFLRPGTDVFSPSIAGKVLWNYAIGGGK